MRPNSTCGKTYRQRSWPFVSTSPSDSSSRYFAGRNNRPLPSRRGVALGRSEAYPDCQKPGKWPAAGRAPRHRTTLGSRAAGQGGCVSAEAEQVERTLDELIPVAHRISEVINTVVVGKAATVRLAMTVLLAEGHALIEDVPGVGKTLMAKALARSIDCSVRRVQFTPDLLPSDITGVSAFNQELREFEFKPGPIFANLVLGDEINRASPKTQSALLESMEERQCTVDGVTYPLESPFMVIATQNPIEMEGTYPLPEAQRDRFTARISIGYPDAEAELAMLDTHGSSSPLYDLRPATHATDVMMLIAAVRRVHVAPAVRQYIIDLVGATRTDPALRLGASPRAAPHLLRASRAYAALEDRNFVIPDDVQTLAGPVLAHRLLPTAEAVVSRELPQQVLTRIMSRVPLPGR